MMTSNKEKMEVIVMPYHAQSHLNTMLQFAKRLAWKAAAHITLATTLSNTHKIHNVDYLLSTECIYDDSNDFKLEFMDRINNFKIEASLGLDRLLSTKPTIRLVVYDADLPWALDVVKQHGVPAAAFFTQSCAYVSALVSIFTEEYKEDVQHPLVGANLNEKFPSSVKLPTMEEFERGLPIIPLSCDSDSGSASGEETKKRSLIHPVIRMLLSHLENVHKADWVLFNSFDDLEYEVVKWMENVWPVKTIGLTVPSAYLDKRIDYDVDYGFNLYKPINESCFNWLNNKQVASVVYVSFGSTIKIREEQIKQVAEALKQIPTSFLWALRESEQEKLPNNFLKETSNKGLVLSWCSQLDVLAHKAVGCFITHCGWNSTIEALSSGVPMLVIPQLLDQLINAYFVDQVWGVGIRPKEDQKKIVTCEEIKVGLQVIMQGERATKIRENADKWKDLTKVAVGDGGTSDKHIDEIIDKLAFS